MVLRKEYGRADEKGSEMVNPQINQESASSTKRGIPKHLLCAPFALAITAAIPMGVAYADETPSAPQESSSSAVESVQDSSSDSSSSSTDSSQSSEAGDSGSSSSESGLTGSDSSASVDEASGAESAPATTAPVTAPAASSGSSSSSGSVTLEDPDIDVDATPTGGSSDSTQAEAPDAAADAKTDADVAANADAALPEEVTVESDATVAAGDRTEVDITGDYKQSEARKMLDLVNADRAKTNGSQALTWDYALEQYAMQRAAEIAYNFSHTRPNGDPFSKEIMTYGYYSVGENIHKATGTTSHGAEKANQAWIDSTGHHINRTKEKWQGYAAACFYLANTAYGPMWCWVELFSTPNGNPNYKAPADGSKTVTVVLKGDNYQIIENSTDDGSNPYSLGWWYDEKKDKFTYVRSLTYTSYVPMYQTDITVMIDGKEYTFTSEGYITKESEKNLPFTREQYLGLVANQPGQNPTQAPQGSNSSSTDPDARPVIVTKSSRSQESLTRVTPGAVRDEYGYTLYLTPDLMNSGARWETQGNRTVFRLADGSLATGWVADGNQRYYLDPNGEMAKGWRRINGAWYFFDSVNGTMKTGLFEFGGDRYYTDEKGAMQTGMVEIDGQRYFAEASGILRPSQEAR